MRVRMLLHAVTMLFFHKKGYSAEHRIEVIFRFWYCVEFNQSNGVNIELG